MNEEEIKEPFNFERAKELLNEGYCVRDIAWVEESYAQIIEGVVYDEDGVESDFEECNPDDPSLNCFELFYETEEECQEMENEEMMDESGTQEDGEHQNKSKSEKEKIETENGHQSKLNEKNRYRKNITSKTRAKLTSEQEKTIEKIEKNELLNEKSGQEIIDKDKIKLSASTTPEIEMNNSRRFLQTVEGETQSSDSVQQLTNLQEAQSQQMNLIDSSVSHLHSLMKSVAPHPGREIYATSTVETNVRVAKELREMMKLKLDCMKFAKELK